MLLMAVNIHPTVNQALSHSQKKSGLSSTMYRISRQIGLLRWLRKETSRSTSIGRNVVVDQTIIYNEYFHTYDLLVNNKSVLMQVWIVSLESLIEEYPSHVPVDINPEFPNLYVAQRSGTDERIVIEISADETAVFHSLLRRQESKPHCIVNDLTEDFKLRRLIIEIQDNFEEELKLMNLPYKVFGSDDNVNLVFPSEAIETYLARLEWLLENGDFSHDAMMKKLPFGGTARRMRKLDMVTDIGSVFGVYGRFSKRVSWEEMKLVERAYHEKRITGYGILKMQAIDIQVIVIMRDRLNDGIGQHLVLSNEQYQVLVTVGIKGEVVAVESHDEDYTKYLTENDELNQFILDHQCDNWNDGLRVYPWLAVMFEIIEQDHEVLPQNIETVLSEWLFLISTSA